METVNTQGSRVITGRKGGWEGERGSLFQRHRGSCPEGLGLRASPLLLHSQRLPDQPSVRASPEASRKKLHREAGLLAEGHMVSKVWDLNSALRLPRSSLVCTLPPRPWPLQ